MTDLALIWDADLMTGDLAMAGADLATDDGLRTAVLISLFTDARAQADDVLPAETDDRRGWWGDFAPEVEGDRIGSRLWLLVREKRTPDLLVRAREYAEEALAWLVEDGVAAAVAVEAMLYGSAGVALGVTITRPGGPARSRFDFVWEATNAL